MFSWPQPGQLHAETCESGPALSKTVCPPQCLAPTYVGDFHLSGATLRRQGLNRIGNMIVPNRNYQLFETWIMPILDAMLDAQQQHGVRWTPSKVRLPVLSCQPNAAHAHLVT